MVGVIKPFKYTEIPIDRSQCKDECIHNYSNLDSSLSMHLICVHAYVVIAMTVTMYM